MASYPTGRKLCPRRRVLLEFWECDFSGVGQPPPTASSAVGAPKSLETRVGRPHRRATLVVSTPVACRPFSEPPSPLGPARPFHGRTLSRTQAGCSPELMARCPLIQEKNPSRLRHDFGRGARKLKSHPKRRGGGGGRAPAPGSGNPPKRGHGPSPAKASRTRGGPASPGKKMSRNPPGNHGRGYCACAQCQKNRANEEKSPVPKAFSHRRRASFPQLPRAPFFGHPRAFAGPGNSPVRGAPDGFGTMDCA